MQIPHHTLEPKTLRRLLSEIVTRDGTDYGAIEHSTDDKVEGALRALESGAAQLFWDETSESASLISVDHIHDQDDALRRLRPNDESVESEATEDLVVSHQETKND